ncbi:MAG: SDR family oxidoreductase [Planctomycetes bacterium]|nr:SDR family oxidoreductase [Planctomycetota bacterium]
MQSSSVWKNRLALVSGGTSGLGKYLVLELARQNCRLAIVGRDVERLESTRSEAFAAGAASVDVYSLDVTRIDRKGEAVFKLPAEGKTSLSNNLSSQDECRRLHDFLLRERCDLLINAVGRSDRGSLQNLSCENVRELFEINVLSSLSMAQMCWDSLCRGSGTIVNIASLAGLVAGPNMGGYSIAKHGLVAMHRQWRTESVGSGVHFLLVCPGPIDRPDSDERYSQLTAQRGLDANSAKPGGGVRLKRLDPLSLSRRILSAVDSKELELVLPSKARWLAALTPLWPSWADRLLRNSMRGR